MFEINSIANSLLYGMRHMYKTSAYAWALTMNILSAIWDGVQIPRVDFPTILVFLIILLLMTAAYIKIRHPFWNIQPVFHTYDYWRYLYTTPFIIRRDIIPMKHKFCDKVQVHTFPYLETTAIQRTQCIDLLRCYYIGSDRVLYTITEPILTGFMTGHSEPTYISFYKEKQYVIEPSNDSSDLESVTRVKDSSDLESVIVPVGCIASRPLKLCFLENTVIMNYKQIPAYYLDFICSHRDYKKKNISRNLIQTHEYNQRIANPNIHVSIFKKETDLCEGIVPLTKYRTYLFYLQNLKMRKLPAHTHVNRVLSKNINALVDFLNGLTVDGRNASNPALFQFCGFSDIGMLTNLINQNQLYVYCLKMGGTICAYYFLKNANTQYEDLSGVNDCDTLQFAASFSNTQSDDVFYLGFLHVLKDILKTKKTFKMLLFEDISHNSKILVKWLYQNKIIMENDSAYYLYNMVVPRAPLSQSSCFFLL